MQNPKASTSKASRESQGSADRHLPSASMKTLGLGAVSRFMV